MTNSVLIKNYTLFHAYFCHLIENRQADAVEDLCEISFKLDQEISHVQLINLRLIYVIN